MKIAIHNPMFSGATGLNGWILEFIKIYQPIIFISDIKYIHRLVYFLYKFKLNPFKYKIIFKVEDLNKKANVLVCFNGLPYLERNRPIKNFKGLKMYHVMDYVFNAELSNKILEESGVNYLFGYSRHDKYCEFFQNKYPNYKGKLLSIPFGFAPRFKNVMSFNHRKNKVIALGSVNSFIDKVHNIEELKELNSFFIKKGERFMHKFRRMLVENENNLSDIMDSKLPHYPNVKDFGYDIVKTLNEYKMSVNCESLLYFPSAKTFEGPASGSVLVCSDHPCFTDLGFEDGVNCIKHKQFDIKDFKDKVSYYLNNSEKLQEIQKNGTKFIEDNYSHKKIAEQTYKAILSMVEKEKI